MRKYIFLMKFTDKGVCEIRDAPKRAEAAIAHFETVCGNHLEIFPVMGEYNYIAIGDAPGDKEVMSFVLGLDTLGNVKTSTHRAFSLEDYSDVINELRLGKTPL